MTDAEAFDRLRKIVDSPENQALPEAERVRMPAGWESAKPEAPWFRIKDRTVNDSDWLFIDNPDPIDLQAASGVLAEWLGRMGCAAIPKGEHGHYGVISYQQSVQPEHDLYSWYSISEPTILSAQVAAVEALLKGGK